MSIRVGTALLPLPTLQPTRADALDAPQLWDRSPISPQPDAGLWRGCPSLTKEFRAELDLPGQNSVLSSATVPPGSSGYRVCGVGR